MVILPALTSWRKAGRISRRLAGLALVTMLFPRVGSAQEIDSSIAITPRMSAPPPCVPDRSQLVGGPRKAPAGPTLLQLYLPPVDNAPRIENPVFLRMRVTVQGTVDSVVVIGVADSAYAARVRQGSMRMRFRPASRDGCLVPEWYELKFELPERR